MDPLPSGYSPSPEERQPIPQREAQTQNLPAGTVTFLFTDIEGSTRLAQEYAAQMPALLARHHEILRQAIAAHNGFVLHITGDSFAVAFHDAGDALGAALDMQQALLREVWSPAPVKVRMGIHSGAAQLREGLDAQHYAEYATIATAQRIMAAGHGGQILLSQTAADLIRDQLPPGVHLLDKRERRLKDIVHPMHIYQIIAPGLPTDFAPLATADAVRHNLPAQLTPFFGREEELAALLALLEDEHTRLVTIMAPGGMGKTRLALEAAARMVEAFPQGLYFVELDRITAAEMVVEAVASVLPISLSSSEDPGARVLDYLRDKKILLVLDNFEHVLEGAAFVQEILRTAPAVQILVTSRARLNLLGETLLRIEGLAAGEQSPAKNSAVQLFAQHARQAYPAFELDEEVLPDVVRICRLVGGMPLAIVLAAAWMATLSVSEIAGEIENSLDILATELRDMPYRQRSVRAVIESSWNQVEPALQLTLQRLAPFRGGFTRAAAREAAGASLSGLSHLVDKALLRHDPQTGRYSIHELLRQYAEKQLALSTEAEQAAHEAHATYYAEAVKMMQAPLRDQRQLGALREIEADLDNIRMAWSYWTGRQDAGRISEFISALWLLFEIRGSFLPAMQLFKSAVQRLTSGAPDLVYARALLQARQAWFSALIGQAEAGLALAQESVDTLHQFDERPVTVETLQCMTINAIFLNRNELLAQVTAEMMARAADSSEPWENGWALVWRAYALVRQGQVGAALQSGEQALAIFEELGNPFGSSVASGIIMGSISMAAGNIADAHAYFLRGAQWAEVIDYRRLLQISYDNLGGIALLQENPEQARELFVKSLAISQACGQTREMLASLRDLASVDVAQGDLASALQLVAVVLGHPASEQNSLNRPEPLRQETEELRAKIESRLEPASYQAAWENGRRQNLSAVVEQILR